VENRGEKPSGAALKLLLIVQKHGLQILAQDKLYE
jgi:DNA-binding transcriptional regulator YiaG